MDVPSMPKRERLFSLDLLRGLDIFLLTAIGPLVWAIHRTWGDYENPAWWLDQVKHPAFGFSVWDAIMPLFLFMSGAAVPLGFSRRLDADGRPTAAFWTHLIRRFAILWLLSAFTHGNLLSLDPLKMNPFAGALFQIALAMVVVSLWMLIKSRKVRCLVPAAALLAYGLAQHLWGDYSLDGSLAWRIDLALRAVLFPQGHVEAAPPGLITPLFLPSVMYAVVIAPCGALTVEYVRGVGSGVRKALVLSGIGLAALALGWTLTLWVPMAKRLMSASFTLASLGWCFLTFALCYYLTDVRKLRRGLGIFTLYGQCSLVAYVLDEQFRPALRAAAETFVRGIPHLIGLKCQELFIWAAMIAIQTWFLHLWRKARPEGRKGCGDGRHASSSHQERSMQSKVPPCATKSRTMTFS